MRAENAVIGSTRINGVNGRGPERFKAPGPQEILGSYRNATAHDAGCWNRKPQTPARIYDRRVKMSSTTPLDSDSQFGALLILDYLMDLFIASALDSFSKDQIVKVLDLVRDDPELIEPEARQAYDEATRDCR